MSQPTDDTPSAIDALNAEREALLAALENDTDYVDPHAEEVGGKARTSEDDTLPSHFVDPDEIQEEIVAEEPEQPTEVETPVTTEQVETEQLQATEQPTQSAEDKLALWLKENNPNLTLEQALAAAKAAQKATEPEKAIEQPVAKGPNLEQLEARRAELKAQRKSARAELNLEELDKIEDELEDLTENLMPAARAAEHQASQALASQFEASGERVRNLYPEATNSDSALYKRMEEIDADLEANGDPLFLSPDKPLRIAQMAARELNIAPKAKAGPAATQPPARQQPRMTAPLKAAGVRAAAPNPTSQLEQQIDAVNSPEKYEELRRQLIGR